MDVAAAGPPLFETLAFCIHLIYGDIIHATSKFDVLSETLSGLKSSRHGDEGIRTIDHARPVSC